MENAEATTAEQPEPEKPLSEEAQDIKAELETAAALEATALSEGGQLLIKGLISDTMAVIDALTGGYGDLTLQQFVAYCADMKTKLDLLRSLSRAEGNKEYLHGLLVEALKK